MIRMPEPGKEVIIGTLSRWRDVAVPPVFDGESYPSTRSDRADGIAADRTRRLSILIRESSEFAFEVISWTCEMLRENLNDPYA
ncbi:MAG: hypothetical protein IPG58_17315 [Acidobacteria bacterium]|nr:hypothetical protein [Acidobacteriota bacterium]